MIFIKRKPKKFFIQHPPLKTTDEYRYRTYKELYGKPQLTSYGEHVWSQMPEKFVRDAKTGNILIRTREVKYLGRSEDHTKHYYLAAKSKLNRLDKPISSFTE